LIFIYAQAENVVFLEKQIGILFSFLSLLSAYKHFLLVMQWCGLSCSKSGMDISQIP